MKPTSYRVSDSLHLVKQTVGREAPKKRAPVPVNHIAVIDCSGSMYYDLPKVRQQLKKRIPKLLGKNDTLSIVWFSGRGQFGTLLEAEPVSTLSDLQDVNRAIDRWLKCVGLTGFKEPIEEVGRLVERIDRKGSVFSLFFMSDGCDNQWNRGDILAAVEKASGKLASTTFVEYGYYADRPLLTAMAEKSGGQLIFSEDFDRYAPLFEAAITKGVSDAPRIEVDIPGDPVGGFVFTMSDGDLLAFAVNGGKVAVPEDTSDLWYVSPSAVGKVAPLKETAACYAAMSLYSTRMMPDVVYPLLKVTGDVRFIDAFSKCFGKDKYSAFMEDAREAAFNKSKRLVDGCDPDKVPRDDAFTVLDLLRLLNDDDGNRLLLDDPNFKYSRIGRGTVDAGAQLSSEEAEQIKKLTEQMASERDVAKLRKIQEEISAITSKKEQPLKFESESSPDGYAISNLTFNETRPNVSVLVRKPGCVDLTGRAPGSLKLKKDFPVKFPSFVYRNYAIVKDGLVNVEVLPVKITKPTWDRLRLEGVNVPEWSGGDTMELTINLKELPVVNRKMVKATSAKVLFELEYALTQARAAQKVYNSIKKEKFPRKSESFSVLYGDDVAAWLKEIGITDYSGFGPRTVRAEVRDYYMGRELIVKLKGLSSLPSLKDVRKRMASGKITASAELMVSTVEEVDKFLDSDIYKNAANQDKVFAAWLDGQSEAATKKVRKLLFDTAQIKFSIIVGQTWFTEFSSIDENSMEIEVDGKKILGTVEAKEVKIEI